MLLSSLSLSLSLRLTLSIPPSPYHRNTRSLIFRLFKSRVVTRLYSAHVRCAWPSLLSSLSSIRITRAHARKMSTNFRRVSVNGEKPYRTKIVDSGHKQRSGIARDSNVFVYVFSLLDTRARAVLEIPLSYRVYVLVVENFSKKSTCFFFIKLPSGRRCRYRYYINS